MHTYSIGLSTLRRMECETGVKSIAGDGLLRLSVHVSWPYQGPRAVQTWAIAGERVVYDPCACSLLLTVDAVPRPFVPFLEPLEVL